MQDKNLRIPFSALPLQKNGPPGNAWDLFGEHDELGMLNLLTAETTREAAKEIVDGTRLPLDLPLNRFNTPAFGRQAFHQNIHHKAPRTVNDDILTFNPQSGTQWDGPRHFGYQEHKLYFNGRQQEDISSTTQNGIHVWVDNGGITGRGVLLDYQSWAESEGYDVKATSTSSITLDDLYKVAASQNVEFRRGDILCVRSGYLKAFNALSDEDARALVTRTAPPAIGVESSENVLRWIWETGFAAVAGDMPSFEAWPCQHTQFFLHEWLLAGWGVPIGELFNFESLATECRRRRKWTFFFNSMPLNVPGGVATPPNAVAIL